MSDDAVSFDFPSVREAANAYLDTLDAPPAAPDATPAPAAAADEGTPAEEPAAEAAATPAEQKVADLTDDTLVKVIVDGKEELKPWKEVRGAASGEFKFTSSMQKLAAERREVETARAQIAQQTQQLQGTQQELQQLRTLLSNPALLQQFAQRAAPQQGPTPEQVIQAFGFQNPDEIMTAGDAIKVAQAIAAQHVQQATGQLTQQFQQAIQQLQEREAVIKQDIRDAQETEGYIASLNDTFSETLKANPILEAIPDVEDLIRFNVTRMNPATLEEAQEAIQKVASSIAEDLNKRFIASNTKKVIEKQKLSTQTIEPPVGTSVQPQPIQAVDSKTNKVNWDALRKAAESY